MAREYLGAAPSVNADLVRKVDLDTSSPPTTALTNSAFAQASGSLTTTTTVTDVPGATVTITTQVANTVVVVYGMFDVLCAGTTTGDIGVGTLNVDGTDVATHNAIVEGKVGASNEVRLTGGQVWRVTLATAGSHTLKLRGSRFNAGVQTGTITFQLTHTTIAVLGRF